MLFLRRAPELAPLRDELALAPELAWVPFVGAPLVAEPLAVAPWSFHVSGEYAFVVGVHDAYARADYTHSTHNSKPLDISSPLVDADIPRPLAASNLDLRSGVKFGNYDISLFVENVMNNHPLLSLVHDAPGSVNFTSTTYRPRTVGLTLTLRR